jgi:hypothetical protein
MTSKEVKQKDTKNNLPANKLKDNPKKLVSLKIFAGSVTGILLLAVLILVVYPVEPMVQNWISQGYTPTPFPPTTTITSTPTTTPTSTPTALPTPTITPMPPSAYQVLDLTSIRPGIPAKAVNAVILNEDTSAQVNPNFSNIQWTHSSTITEQLGIEMLDPYYATFGSGAVTWSMDVPLPPGLYELFVMDTLYSSGGALNFTVNLGNSEVQPIIGEKRVEFQSSRGTPPQTSDQWRSIGMYNLDRPDILLISTSWDQRNEYTIVAIDRVLILQLPDSHQQLLEMLPPQGGNVQILDESSAEFETVQYWVTMENAVAWGEQFEMVNTPPIASTVTWMIPNSVPISKYEVLVWIPEINGTAEVIYRVLANGTNILLPEGSENGDIQMTQGHYRGGQWVSLGTWSVPPVYGDSVKLSLQLETISDSVGDAAVDAIAFIQVP